jgi:hypothetical protein
VILASRPGSQAATGSSRSSSPSSTSDPMTDVVNSLLIDARSKIESRRAGGLSRARVKAASPYRISSPVARAATTAPSTAISATAAGHTRGTASARMASSRSDIPPPPRSFIPVSEPIPDRRSRSELGGGRSLNPVSPVSRSAPSDDRTAGRSVLRQAVRCSAAQGVAEPLAV